MIKKHNLVLFFLICSKVFSTDQYLTPTQSLNHGTGLVFMPTARFQSEGMGSMSFAYSGPYNHYRLTLTPFNWAEGTVFYNDLNTIRYTYGTKQSYKDKGFSAKFKLPFQTKNLQLAVGLEDLAGTGRSSSEYVVGSYARENYDISIGIGWGKLGTRNNFSNPLKIINSDYDQRDLAYTSLGGVPEIGRWFKGDASLFGGIEFLINRQYGLTGKLEYSSYDYNKEYTYYLRETELSRFNFGISHQLTENIELNYYHTRGNEWSFQFVLKELFSQQPKSKITSPIKMNKADPYLDLLTSLKENGILLQKSDISKKNTLRIEYIQTVSNNEYDAIKEIDKNIRKNNPDIETIEYSPRIGPFELSTVKSYSNSKFLVDEPDLNKEYDLELKVIYPAYDFATRIGYKNHIGSPSGFIFTELSVNPSLAIVLSKNIEFESIYTIPLWDNYEKMNYNPGYTTLHPVRIDVQSYLKLGRRGFDQFQMSYMDSLSKEDHLFLSIGEFEQMYGGIHFEYLKRDFDKLYSYGFEVSRVNQRDFKKKLFNYRNYTTTTGHFNFYLFEPKNEILFKTSFGKYLAKDIGFTFEVSRMFKNGVIFGGFFSRTNISAEEFGEGSFDKGIFFRVPTNFGMQPQMNKGFHNEIYRPLTRDGASKLNINKELFYLTEFSSKYRYFLK